ncbi:BrxE family protein [Geomonas propionica]|uniref:BrxE family protein n=1 Tax=Geomonas propionica TaxID=2798582 RepID=A0ABS0YP65_9BACT|nr:BrxE family protein [Geomonas propionica]MBJ6799744.1 BrxE family protein [Geomonas propionica]
MNIPSLERLLKLRLVVARIGEMDNARWWNTNKLLGSMGTTALKRGFPVSHNFAQARAVFAVATARSQEIFPHPHGTITLWCLPAELEDEFNNSFQEWHDSLDVWTPFFESIKALSGSDLIAALKELNLIDDSIIESTKSLRRSAENRAVMLPSAHHIDDQLITMLACAFSLSESGSPTIPYVKVEA